MPWLRWFVLGVLAAGSVVVAFRWYHTSDSARGGTDLVARLDAATVRRPNPEVFSVASVTIGSESRRAIAVTGPSRVAWDISPVAGEWLEVELGLQEAAWASEAHAVLFRVGVSYDGHYEDLISRVVNPAATADDRAWIPLEFDLSAFAGRTISLIFNTTSAPGAPVGHVHHAVWGVPTVVRR